MQNPLFRSPFFSALRAHRSSKLKSFYNGSILSLSSLARLRESLR
jgi:hypothetical protein